MYDMKVLGLEEVQKAVETMIKEVSKQIRPASITVVDKVGDLIMLVRTDGARPYNNEMSIRKAYTSARAQRDTSVIGEQWKERGWSTSDFGTQYTTVPGGVAIVKPGEGSFYGGIGVAGLIPAAADEAVAKTGLKTIQDALWPSK